ncbi:hypothetical protein [Bacillus mycoides]|uniref:hypothetical protein n=1 Tax=Bacillus mycoides TaxID=1405 RepID=UPI001F247F7F|nr:hypothetical protein [Bacillus mycoides]
MFLDEVEEEEDGGGVKERVDEVLEAFGEGVGYGEDGSGKLDNAVFGVEGDKTVAELFWGLEWIS